MTVSRPILRLRVLALTGVLLALSACGGSGSGAGGDVVVRSPDDQQVLTPAEVAAMREDSQAGTCAGGTGGATGDTIPLEEADPTERLFSAYSDFSRCMEDGGQSFRGDPRSDPSLLQDKEYMDVIQRCAARSDILGALEALQKFNENLTPDEVEERNDQFLQLKECLEDRGWTVVVAPDANGLLTPSQFTSAAGELNERDIRQCGSDIDTD